MVEQAGFYGWMADDGRILRGYKEDATAFLIRPGPDARMSEAQHLLQRYLLSHAGRPHPANGHAHGPGEAAAPLLARGGHGGH